MALEPLLVLFSGPYSDPSPEPTEPPTGPSGEPIENGAVYYHRDTYTWDTIAKQVQLDGPERTAIRGNTISRPPEDVVDEYVVPGSGEPGYDPAAVGQTRKVYHIGGGEVGFFDSGSCDLQAYNVVVTPATEVGGTGAFRVDLSTSYPPITATVVRLSDNASTELAGTYTNRISFSQAAVGAYRLDLSDAQGCTRSVLYTIEQPATGPDGEPLPVPLGELSGLNVHTFPLVAGLPLDTPDPACPDAPYYLAVPTDRFLPFCLRRPADPSRRLACAWVEHALSGEKLLSIALTPTAGGLAYEKFTDGTTDFFLYYGALIAGVSLPACVPLRLRIDEFTSVAFQAVNVSAGYLRASWSHPQPLSGIPYGTGFEQVLYVVGATLREGPPREERVETKNAATGAVRVDFLLQTRTASFVTEPLPAYLVQAVEAAKSHAQFTVSGIPEGSARLLDVKQTPFTPDSCSRSLVLSVEDTRPLLRSNCGTPMPQLEPVPAGFTPGPCL